MRRTAESSLVDMTYPELANMQRRERLEFLLHEMHSRLAEMLRQNP
jgi:hypothetical protein